MAKEKDAECCSNKWQHVDHGGGAVYGIGLVGALIYFIHTATSFWDGVVGVLQALVWPAYFVYYIFNYLKL